MSTVLLVLTSLQLLGLSPGDLASVESRKLATSTMEIVRLSLVPLDQPAFKVGDNAFRFNGYCRAICCGMLMHAAEISNYPASVQGVCGNWIQIRPGALMKKPAWGNAWVYRADVGTAREAVVHYTKLFAEHPSDKNALEERWIANCHLHDYDSALIDLNELIRIDPNTQRYCNRGWHQLYRMKRPREALADYDEAVELNPQNSQARYFRGQVHRALGDADRALADFEYAVWLFPEYDQALAECSYEWFLRGEDQKAQDMAASTIWISAYYSRAYELQGLYHYTANRQDEAVLNYTEVVRVQKRNASAWSRLGRSRRHLGHEAEARADFLEALRLQPQHVEAHTLYAWQLATCENPEFRDGALALQHAQLACEASQWKDMQALQALAAAYAETNHFGKAASLQLDASEGLTFAERPRCESIMEAYRSGRPWREKLDATTISPVRRRD